MHQYSPGSSLLDFNAGIYRMQEISVWTICRQQYQVIDDMFGSLIPSNEPSLVLYLQRFVPGHRPDRPDTPHEEIHRRHRGRQRGFAEAELLERLARSRREPVRGDLRAARHAQPLHPARRRAHRLRHRPLPHDLLGHHQLADLRPLGGAQRGLRVRPGLRPHALRGEEDRGPRAHVGLAGPGRRPDLGIRRGRAPCPDGEPDPQALVRGRHLCDLQHAHLGEPQVRDD